MTIDEAGSVSGSALGRARTAALAELRRRPVAVSWRRDAARTLLAVLGTTALVIGVGTWLSIVEPGRLGDRLLQVALLVALQSLGVFAAIAPGRAALRWTGALLAVAAVAAILIGRGVGVPHAAPAIACAGSHLAIDLIPLGLVLYSLRRFSWSLGRATLAGAAVAATGAIAGELGCTRGWMHALIYHLGAGVVIVAACVLISRAIRPQTFAP
jgi:hypothetical protein